MIFVKHSHGKAIQGFTLIELSIVLVIIGLIVGGVLVGRDLISAAELRSQVSQIEKLNTATKAFRLKYGALPGDINASNAIAFGFAARTGGRGRGDGNGLIDSALTYRDYNQTFSAESALFWNDLSVATFIDGNFTGAQNQDSTNPLPVTATQVATTFPTAKLGRGNYIAVGSLVGDVYGGHEQRNANHWLIVGILSVNGGVSNGTYNTSFNITPMEAYNMDVKIDDGLPNSGTVQQPGTPGEQDEPFDSPGNWQATPADGTCTTGGTDANDPAATYNISAATGGKAPACAISFRFN